MVLIQKVLQLYIVNDDHCIHDEVVFCQREAAVEGGSYIYLFV